MQCEPEIHSRLDLTGLCEVEDAESGAVLRSTFYYVDGHDAVWFGQVAGMRKYDLTLEMLKQNLHRVPDWRVYPSKTSSITEVPSGHHGEQYFIKRPKLLCLDNVEEANLVPIIFVEEVETLEFLSKHPHSNIVRYYGCTIKDGRLTGIVLKKYPAILQYRYEDDPSDFDISKCLEGVQAGVDHLHSLSLAHNDINPMNVALDEDDNPVILDFGSCKKFDAPLVSGGTPGWTDESVWDISSKRHDEFGIMKLRTWLLGQHSKRLHNAVL